MGAGAYFCKAIAAAADAWVPAHVQEHKGSWSATCCATHCAAAVEPGCSWRARRYPCNSSWHERCLLRLASATATEQLCVLCFLFVLLCRLAPPLACHSLSGTRLALPLCPAPCTASGASVSGHTQLTVHPALEGGGERAVEMLTGHITKLTVAQLLVVLARTSSL
jgi:hypothetical protein